MNDPLAHLLRNAHPELISAFLLRQHAPGLKLSGTPRQRNDPVANYLTTLRTEDDAKAAEIEFQARRVEALSRSQYDRQFRNYINTESLEQTSELSHRDKALWLWTHQQEDFDAFEREVSLDHLQSLRHRRTRFQTRSERHFRLNASNIEQLETTLKGIYLRYDGSGKFVTSYPPQESTSANPEFAFSLSQPLRHLQRYSDDGETEDDLVRGITWGHISYDKSSGKLHVSATRGRKEVRNKIAEAFALCLLDISTPPAVVPDDWVELRSLANRSELSPLPSQEQATAKIVGMRLQHPSILAGTRMELRNKAGLPGNTLRQLFGTNASASNILSVDVKITDYVPEGSDKAVTVTLTLHNDASLSFGGTPVDRQVLEASVRKTWFGKP